MDPITTALTELGPLGLFAAFLAWQYATQQKKIDGMIDKFQEQIKELQKDSAESEERLRDRYDSVIREKDEQLRLKSDSLESNVERTLRNTDELLSRAGD